MYQKINRTLDLAKYYNKTKDKTQERNYLEQTRDSVCEVLRII